MGSQYESEKVGMILAQEELNGLQLVQFEFPMHRNPPVISHFEVGGFPFSHNRTSGVIRMGSQYEGEKVGKFHSQERLDKLHLVHFECPMHWKPPV